MQPSNVTDDYAYELPAELIAQQPLAHRADSRLMIVNRDDQSIAEGHFRDLPEYLRPGDCLVLNNTQVLPAKLMGKRLSTGGRWQGLFLEHDEDHNWKLLCKTRGTLRVGDRITLFDQQGNEAVVLRLLTKLDGGAWGAKPETSEPTWQLLQRIGRIPLPHYIRHGDALPTDTVNYQTVFAERLGSVAAPTAGLHFTTSLLDEITQRGCQIAKVTLHVGVGTFRPIQTSNLDEHQMHEEWCEVPSESAAIVRETRQRGGRIIAVGTTSVRTLESAAARSIEENPSPASNSRQRGIELQPWTGRTNLFIRPPYRFQMVDGLITNFHLPRSTLLVLVSTFAGRELILRAYDAAIDARFRFYSYGDAMLIL